MCCDVYYCMLSIGNLTLNSPLVLAPMSGISDLAYRLINRSFGCQLAFTEMIGTDSLVHNSRNTLRMLSTREDDRPLGVQILGCDPDLIKRSLDILTEYPLAVLDFNAACPVKKVVSRGKGAALLKEPSKLQQLLSVIVKNKRTPVTVKMRAGWDDEEINAPEIALRAQDAGVDALFIHGRTRKQRYSGQVDYHVIREVKESVQIPVIASGDALSPELIHNLLSETGCDGVAIARGALGNPWIFREAIEYVEKGNLPERPDIIEISRIMKDHLLLNMGLYGEKNGVIRFRKFFAWYARGMRVKDLKRRAFSACTRDEMLEYIAELGYRGICRQAEI
jgi:tRNA-dihydrouridine synthase B